MTLVGHEDAWRQWREGLSGERMHHAWLLAGKKGLGKMHFALAAARELVAEPGIPQPEGPHPDILVLTNLPKDEKEEKKRDDGKDYELARNIKIDQVREMQRRLTTRPTLGARRAVIFDPADDLEKNAANALLKSLEEPPAGTFFLLVAHRPARLLPTIRSRCRTLRFPLLDETAVAKILAESAPDADPATRAAAIAAAAGSPGAALEFVAQELGPVDALMQRIVQNGDPDFALRGKLAAEIGARPDRERMAAVLDLARATLARMAANAPRAALPAIVDAHADIVRLSAQAPTHNFDPGLLVMQIGGLLASAAAASSLADA
ncbi:DNA polymerase III subunit tau [Tsuneonella dongtanensis]|uniref:DNA polymerase III subunit tau n=1 Tax=Tsuneonella dongtanensis TaxID=692370 RepID=A0A1B2AF45_9SPHN|nr:DNA polymerase III subunit delta' [Tsuneonella dongtanensis]ANY20655.1 DNA polymerase III subunit tau [Tsuneonella dongtanensis]